MQTWVLDTGSDPAMRYLIHITFTAPIEASVRYSAAPNYIA